MKKCTKCGTKKDIGKFYKDKVNKNGFKSWCIKCDHIKGKRYYIAHRKEKKEYGKQYYINHRKKRLEQTKQWTKNNPKKRKIAQKRFREKNRERIIKESRDIRVRALQHYGNKCVCCKETEPKFLAFDHIKGKGTEHRKMIGINIARWILKNDYPNIIQILCHNCNMAKGLYGKCPHKSK